MRLPTNRYLTRSGGFFIAISKQIHRVCSDIATPAGDWV
nr:MAG TPA_asm: hypothetical protein [Caudoviricetes sp.]